MSQNTFDQLQNQWNAEGIGPVFESLVERLKAERKYHDLFDVLLMRSRNAHGLPAMLSTPLDELPEPKRSRIEEAYLAACREVGMLLLAEDKLREAWMYLRPCGDRGPMAEALAKTTPSEENLQDLIEIALHEGVAPALGFELVLNHYGVCNSITTFEGALTSRPRADQQAAATLLLRRVHGELLANVRADIARQQGREPAETSLGELVRDRDWLFADNNYHLDTTHLAATVRFARLLEDVGALALAEDLTAYGRRLNAQFQFAGEEPFADVYPSHALWFAAQLGRQVDEAVAYFRERAQAISVAEFGTAAAETYIALLARLKRHDEALEATIELIPAGTRTAGFAPNLLELARLSGSYERFLAACRQRGDIVGFTAGLAEQSSGA
jgi:hypothetical protein